MAELVQVTDAVHLSRGDAVNWTLVADDTGVMLVDAGYPGDREDVLGSLAELGYGPGDVRAIVLTHAHIDHLGTAIWLASEHGIPVYCHADEVGHAKRSTWSRCRLSMWRFVFGGPDGRSGPRMWSAAAA